MKIRIISTQYDRGGAANASLRLHRALLNDNTDSCLIVRESGKPSDPYIKKIPISKIEKIWRVFDKIFQRLYINKNRTPISTTLYSSSFERIKITKVPEIWDADIINLHWVEKFISPNALRLLASTGKQIVWTLHDERAYTGGCHYTAGCIGFHENCKHCPQLNFDPFRIAEKELQRKKKIIAKMKLAIIATSKWHYYQIKRSSLFSSCPVYLIPNSIDIKKYLPMDKDVEKKKLNIATDVITLQFGAHNINDLRKGYFYLKEALDICMQHPEFSKLNEKGKIAIIQLGRRHVKDTIPIKRIELGYIRDPSKMVEIYNATDIFILPSLEDNLPYTMIESMSCGTPVIGFQTGGIPDVVDKDCGILVPQKDSKALADAIIELVLNTERLALMSVASRAKIVKEFSYEHQSAKYVELFETLLQET